MRSRLLDPEPRAENARDGAMSLVNPRMCKVALQNEEVLARQGAMVAYQGKITFAFEGAGGIKRLFKKALTGEGVPLMRCSGTGDLFLARHADELHLVDLEGDSLTVNGANVLAFDPALTWDIRKVEGATIMSGDVFNMVFSGHGAMALSATGTPVVLDATTAPVHADIQSAIAWSSQLKTEVVRSAGVGALVGRGSGEAFQLRFEGAGFVVVQASEGPFVPKHNHSNVSDWLT